MINSVFNEGVKGMQSSHREMLKSAHEIARANIREAPPTAPQMSPPPGDEQALVAPVEPPRESSSTISITESIVELRRQELLFSANAKVISSASRALGSLIDVRS